MQTQHVVRGSALEPTTSIAVGSVVRLRSGGPPLTVIGVGPGGELEVVYSDEIAVVRRFVDLPAVAVRLSTEM